MERSMLNKCTCTSLVALLLFLLGLNERTILQSAALTEYAGPRPLSIEEPKNMVIGRRLSQPRPHVFDLSDFGAVGDGVTDNTRVFQNAIYAVSTVADKGGGQLYVPPGVFVTGSFNLTSCMTLYLSKDAVIKGIEEDSAYPLLPPLPSYGRGREMPGSRHSSLVFGQNLTDVVIAGDGGIIDGSGAYWWSLAQQGKLKHTRPPLVQLLWSEGVTIANITLKNAPYWTLHTVYSRDIDISGLIITAPSDSPNTIGIAPDSCQNVSISHCTISTGDDCIGIKSGWDQYGLAFALPSRDISVLHCSLACPRCAALSIGSEMSGGVEDVRYSNVTVRGTSVGFALKTAPGRGGYIRNVVLQHLRLWEVTTAIEFHPQDIDHPDDKYDRSALPSVHNVSITSVNGSSISVAGNLFGLEAAPFRCIQLLDVQLEVVEGGRGFRCKAVEGSAKNVWPRICPELAPSRLGRKGERRDMGCALRHVDDGGDVGVQ